LGYLSPVDFEKQGKQRENGICSELPFPRRWLESRRRYKVELSSGKIGTWKRN
jgi:hypothetical protein